MYSKTTRVAPLAVKVYSSFGAKAFDCVEVPATGSMINSVPGLVSAPPEFTSVKVAVLSRLHWTKRVISCSGPNVGEAVGVIEGVISKVGS